MVITEEIGALLANVHDTRVVGISLYPTGDLIVIQVKDIDATYADADESRGVRPGEIVLSGVTEARIAVDFREGLRTGAIE